MKKNKLGTIGNVIVTIPIHPDIRLSLDGIRTIVRPGNLLTKLLWRFLKIKVTHKESPSLWELMPKVPVKPLKVKKKK